MAHDGGRLRNFGFLVKIATIWFDTMDLSFDPQRCLRVGCRARARAHSLVFSVTRFLCARC